MNLTKKLLLIYIFGFAASTLASADLYVWEPGEGYPRFVLPVPANQTPEEAAQQYISALNADPELESVREGRTVSVPMGRFSRYQKSDLSNAWANARPNARPRFAVIANRLEHLFVKHSGSEMEVELGMVSRKLVDAGADVYVLPVVSDVALHASEQIRFREDVAYYFDGLLALGGKRDVDPALYGEKLTYAKDSNRAEDESEIALIREFVRTQHGVFYGFCKGHQLFGVANGAKMIQDIAAETTSVVNHRDGEHRIVVDADSVLAHIVGYTKIWVNSYHHQAVIDQSGLGVKTVASTVEANGARIVEALESDSGFGVTFQFHPEYMESALGRKIIQGLVRFASA